MACGGDEVGENKQANTQTKKGWGELRRVRRIDKWEHSAGYRGSGQPQVW